MTSPNPSSVSPSRAAEFESLADLAALGMSGQTIARHRSLFRFAFPKQRLASVLLVPLVFNLLIWRLQPAFADFFAWVFRHGLPRLGLSADVSLSAMGASLPGWVFPVVSLPSRAPGPVAWSVSAAAVVALLIASRHIPDRFLPFAYLLRFVAFIHSVSLLYFATCPAAFPYDLPTHLAGSFETGMWFMMVLPWVLGLVYNVFEFSLWRKLALPLMCTLFLGLAIPFQLLTHAYVLSQGSLLFLPVLYLVFGILPLTLGCIGIYGLGMSWESPLASSIFPAAKQPGPTKARPDLP